MLGLFCEKNMAIQTANLGTAPSGAGGDTFRSAATKFNENFTNNAHAASRLVGTQAGNVMEVGVFGLGGNASSDGRGSDANNVTKNGIYNSAENSWLFYGAYLHMQLDNTVAVQIGTTVVGDDKALRFRTKQNGTWNPVCSTLTDRNTTTDSNGFIKAASPIVKLFADKVELNDEAQQQEIIFEKLGVGDYLIKGSTGFAQEGWYVETPKDANGNSLVAVVYEQLENQDISVKTYNKKFDIGTASIVADLEQAIDIPVGRWIDIRLQELPQPEFVPPVSNTPASFQPTGIAQAVSEMMNGTEQ